MKVYLLKYLLLLFSATLFGFPVHAEIIKINSEPDGVNVVVKKSKNLKVIDSCVTPCTMKIRTKKAIYLYLSKEGYESTMLSRVGGTLTGDILNFYPKLITLEEIEARRLKTQEKREKYLERFKTEIAEQKWKPPFIDSDRPYSAPVSPGPKFPLKNSGHCRVLLDVGTDGKPYNIRTPFCTDDRLSPVVIRDVKRWLYFPKKENGVKVPRYDVGSKVTYNMLKRNGEILPHPKL